MALSRTGRLNATSAGGFGTGAFTTGAFTPSNNSLLVVGVGMQQEGGTTEVSANMTISDSAGLTWTRRVNYGSANTGGFNGQAVIWTAPVATGASMTLTLDCGSDNANSYYVSAVDYTGYDTVSSIGSTGQNQQNSGISGPPSPASCTLGANPATSSEVFAFCAAGCTDGSFTPGAGWTEVHETGSPGGGYGSAQSQVRAGSTSTSVDWDSVRATGTALFNWVAVAIEVRVGVSFTFLIRQNMPLR